MSTNQALQVITLLIEQSDNESDQVLFTNTITDHHHYVQDICIYNFSCLRPAQRFLPFNSVFSNIAYIGAGLLSSLPTNLRTCPRLPLPRLRLAEELEEAQGSQGVSTFGG